MRRMLLLIAVPCLPLYLIGCAATTSVTRPITVTVSPTVASVPVGQTQAFIATVTGTPNPAFRKIEIDVADPSTPDYVLAHLVGYIAQSARR